MKTKHTPAPWFIRSNGEIHDKDTKFDKDGARVGDTPIRIAKVELDIPEHTSICSKDWDDTRGHANAHLIAAAPELLEALENLVFMATCERDGVGKIIPHKWLAAVEAAQKAIDKAKAENK